jgi:spore maturation protein CgeB
MTIPGKTATDAKALSILYLGPDHLTSGHRAEALRRLGHTVAIVNPRSALPNNRLVNFWNHQTGCAFLEGEIQRRILKRIPNQRFDLVFAGATELISPSLVRELKARFGTVIGYNIDDPFGGRDGRRWRLYLESVPFYDLVVVVRDSNVAEAAARGAKDVFRVLMAADEVAHRPRELKKADYDRWSSEVAFIGTWMPERGPFLARLVQLGVPLSIFGNRWDRAAEWSILQPYWRGPAVDNDEDYPKAVQCAKICLGLLSKGNRDLSTTRSFEIPHLGGVLCAERTSEHEALYQDGEEAVFWSSPEECAEKCLALLADSAWRLRISVNGRARCIQNRTTNECVMADILERAGVVHPAQMIGSRK